MYSGVDTTAAEVDRSVRYRPPVDLAKTRQEGRPARIGAAQIAATALRHGLAIATRNTDDFAACEAPLINSWLAPGRATRAGRS